MAGNAVGKMERLVDRLMEGRLVPFVGAGISIGARAPDDSSFEPSVRYLTQRVAAALKDHFSRHPDPISQAQLPPEAGGTGTNPRLEDLPLDRFSETASWHIGKNALCEALGISQFARLAPRPAHRYIAYLAREGLMNEVFTTNYDCCIERAFLIYSGDERYPKGDGVDAIGVAEMARELTGLAS